MKKYVVVLTLFSLMLVDCSQIIGGGDDVTTGTAVGYLYCSDGKAAEGAIIRAIPTSSLPFSTPALYFSRTDAKGRYVFPSLPGGVYNLYSTHDSLYAMLEQVPIHDQVTLPNDTLKKPGSIDGKVRLSGGEDCRTVLIMVMGGDANAITGPVDTTGVFYFKNLAEGDYRIRFLSTLGSYPVLDTLFNVRSSKDTDVGNIILTKTP